MILESHFGEFFCVEDISAVENQRILHGFVDDFPTGQSELLPLSEQE